MQKTSDISLISLVFIKTRAYLYPMLPFEFGIAGNLEFSLAMQIPTPCTQTAE
jgi:hypothetical protein